MERNTENVTLFGQSLFVLEQAQKTSFELLSQFANSADFQADLNLAFGDTDPIQVANLVKQWSSGDFTSLPNVEILPSTVIDGASGAFSPDTDKIYLSQEYLSTASPAAITTLLLHEIGHFVETQVANFNRGGEVGEIFANFARGQTLTPSEIQTLKLENDTATIVLDGQQITIAKATPYTGTNLGDLTAGLDKALDILQKAVDGQALGNSLPLLGDTLKNNPAAQFITKLQKAINDELAKLPNPSAPTADDIKQALNTAASKLGILKGLQQLDSADRVEYVLTLGEDLASVSTPLATDIGLPFLGLKVSGNADTKIGYDFKLSFGVDKTKGFFLDTAQDSLDLKLGVTTPNLAADASLGFLTFKAKDTGTKFEGDFAIDIKSASPDNLLFLSDITAIGTNYQNLVDAKLKGGADVELNLGATTGVKGLPSVGTDLSIKWNFNGLTNADPTNKGSFGDAPAISFNHVTVDAGSAISDFIGPVLKEVKDVTEPLQPIIDIINSPLPVIDSSLIQLAETLGFSSPETANFISQLSDVITLVNSIPTNGDAVKIDLGSFSFGGNDIRTTLASNIPGLSALGSAPANPLLTSSGVTASFINQLQKLAPEDNGLKLDFPLLKDPNVAISLLLGKSGVDLFTFQPPQLSNSFDKSYFVPILGPLGVEFALKADVRAGIKIGYDSTGLSEFKAGGDASQLFDGFYASRPDGAGINGNNVYLYGDLTAGAGVGIGIASLTVGGGIALTTVFNLAGTDGKVRPSDFASKPIFQLFNPSGGLDAILFGQLRLDFGFFSFNERLVLADERLIDFSASNTSPNESDHYNVENNSDALIKTRDGSEIIKRVGTTGNDNIIVTHTGDGAKGENLRVTGLDPAPKDYTDVKLIVIKGREGDDTIDLSDVRSTPGQINGGVGNDTIIGGGGDDFLMGDAGNNFLDGRGGSNTVDYSAAATDVFVNLGTGTAVKNGYGGVDTLANIQNAVGSKFNDTLIAGDADAVLQGGDGDDTLQGGKGDDVLMGGNGTNTLDGGGGTNTVSYLFAKGPVDVNLSSQDVGSSTLIISPVDGAILYESANTAVGGYGVVNDTIKNIQNLQGSTYDDILVAGNAAPTGIYTSKNGFSYTGSYIDGSQGNDLIYAGAGSDVLDGGQGINWLSYALSTAAVNVNLTPGTTQSGGYADGDRIRTTKDEYTDNKGKDTNLSSFQNLEGSTYADTLRGDGGDNIIRGGAGNDSIFGNGGNDTLIGGAGEDLLVGGTPVGTLRAELSSSDIANGTKGGGVTASYADSPGAVTVNLGTRSGQNSDAQGDQLFGIQNLIGSDRADVFFGDNISSSDFNAGLSSGGTDVVIGGTGHTNSLTVDYSLGDYGQGIKGGFSNASANSGAITRYGSDGTTTLDAVNFLNIDRLFLTGTIQDDNITGGSNVKGDVIFAGAGNDTVNGGRGNDYLDGGDGIDTLSKYLGDRTASITLTGIDPSDPNAKQFDGTNLPDGSVTIQNFEVFKDITTGNGTNDRLIQPGRVDNNFVKVGNGSNYVDPGIGFDTVDGGLGGLFATRTLHVDYSQGDTGSGMTFGPGFADGVPSKSGLGFRRPLGGNDPYAFQDSVNFKNFDQYEITGTSKSDNITGGDGNDTLSGGSGGKDTLDSGRGNDTLFASSGGSKLTGTNNANRGVNNTYNLPQDQDTLIGGAGADTFVLGDQFTNTQSINSFAPGGIYYAHNFYDGSGIDLDLAFINNFDPSKGDVIQLRNLKGYSPKYNISKIDGTEIFSLGLGYTDKNGFAKSDTLALITGNFTDLDLNSSAFNYVGSDYTPPIIK